MYDPLTATVRLQVAGMTAWLSLWRLALRQCAHVTEQQARLLAHHPLHRWHDIIPDGADWLDHYGRRCHDVDVEHLR